MNKTDKIGRASNILAESVKDSVTKNVINHVRSTKIEINDKQLQSLIQVVSVSVNEGHQLALRTFLKSVDSILVD